MFSKSGQICPANCVCEACYVEFSRETLSLGPERQWRAVVSFVPIIKCIPVLVCFNEDDLCNILSQTHALNDVTNSVRRISVSWLGIT